MRSNWCSSSALIPLGFSINLFGVNRTAAFVNNNGNITFSGALEAFTPVPLQNTQAGAIIAPFWADVDTRPSQSGVVAYSSGALIDGHKCFAVTWPDVGYFARRTERLNAFQLVLIERADVGTGNFDVEFNYEKVEWETGMASRGINGLGGLFSTGGTLERFKSND